MSASRQARSESAIAGAAALDKAFALVDRIAAAPSPVSAADLARESGLPRSTLFRILGALEARGYVRRDTRERGWRLGLRLVELAQAAWTGFDVAQAAEAEMARLPEVTGETVQLATLDGDEVVIVSAAAGTQAIGHAPSVGLRTTWTQSAGGLALVAFADAATRSAALLALPAASREGMQATLELVRGRGYAIGSDSGDGVADLAAPLLDVRGQAAAALVLAGPAYRLDDRRLHALAPVLMAAARRASHEAGGNTWSLSPSAQPGAPSRALVVVDAADALVGEAPYWSPEEGALWWVDMLRPALHRYQPDSCATRAWPLPGLASAAVPRQGGGVVLVAGSGLYTFSPGEGKMVLLAHPESGRPDQRYNDAKCDARGRLLVGTLDTAGRPGRGNLWRIDPDGRATQLDEGFTAPNGLAFDAAGTTLYFADSAHRTIYAYAWNLRTGTVSNRRVFATFDRDIKPDGLATDVEGGVWAAVWDGWRVERYDARGKLVTTIHLPVPRPTSVAFGGPDLGTLFITSARARLDPESLMRAPSSGALFSIDAGVAGTQVSVFGT